MSVPGGAASVPFDARPLTEPVDPREVRAFARALRQSGALGTGAATIAGFIVVGVVLVGGTILIGVFVTIFVSIFASLFSQNGSSGIVGVLFSFFPFVLVIGAGTAIGVAVYRAMRGSGARRYRLDRFATANGMSYVPQLNSPGLPGMIFGLGSSRQSSDIVRGDRPRFVEFANYRYTTGSGKNRSTHEWGYVAVKLDVPLPHIVLDATGNNGLFGSNLPTTFDKDQRLSLEGDFDRFFALYCPSGYERDALYLFTPDIMARFIDNAAALDVEIVDDWLFLYGRRSFSTLDPATWAWLFSVVAALLDKFAQWARWRDDNLAASAAAPGATGPGTDAAALGTPAPGAQSVPFAAPLLPLRPPPGVAAPGRRLRRGVPWAAVIVVGVFALVWLFPQILGFFAALFGFGR